MLNNYRNNEFEIWVLRSKIDDAFPSNTSTWGENISGKGGVNSKTENAAFKLMENKKRNQRKIEKLKAENQLIDCFINSLRKRDQDLVNMRVKDKRSWSEIAVLLNFKNDSTARSVFNRINQKYINATKCLHKNT